MRVKIVSDGTRQGTTVVDVATGETLQFVKSVVWSIDAEDGYARATIEVVHVEIDAGVSPADLYEKNVIYRRVGESPVDDMDAAAAIVGDMTHEGIVASLDDGGGDE